MRAESTCSQDIDCYAGENYVMGKEREGENGLAGKLNTKSLYGVRRGSDLVRVYFFLILLLSFVRDGCITDGLNVAADRIRVRPQMQTAKTICSATTRAAFQSRGGPSGAQVVGKARRLPVRLGQSRLFRLAIAEEANLKSASSR